MKSLNNKNYVETVNNRNMEEVNTLHIGSEQWRSEEIVRQWA